MSAAMNAKGVPHRDRRLFLGLASAMLLLIAVVSLFAPSTANNDPRPSSYNSAPGGVKAAYLMLESLGRPVARWDQPLEDLAGVDATHTVLLLPEPLYSSLEKERLAASLKDFLDRGGRIVTSGDDGALLIPGGSVKSGRRFGELCYTHPEGPGPLAQFGEVEMQESWRWGTEEPAARVEQRCGPDAVVVRVPVGRGEAIWWSSASPMTNAELHNDNDLRLFLASLGEGRRVLFDESLQQEIRSKWSATHGLPLRSLLAQAALVFCLLVFSFSRRRGPVRLPVTVGRSSPVEFAVSMGDLYEKAGATAAATEAARRRLQRVLVRDGGFSQQVVEGEPDALATALTARFGGSWHSIGEHLREAAAAADVNAKPGTALALVRALGEDRRRIEQAAHPSRAKPSSLSDPPVDEAVIAERFANLPSPVQQRIDVSGSAPQAKNGRSARST